MSTESSQVIPQDGKDAYKQAWAQLKIGIGVMIVTLVGVVAAFVPVGTANGRSIAVGIAIVVNAFLVAGLSMHLKSEKKTITQFLVFTVIFTIVLFALTALAFFDSTGHRH